MEHLALPQTPLQTIPHMVIGPLCQAKNNSKVTHTYSIINDLVKSPSTMSSLECLPTFPTPQKSLLSSLGEIDPVDSRLMDFNLDNTTLHLPSIVAFQIWVTIHNINIHHLHCK